MSLSHQIHADAHATALIEPSEQNQHTTTVRQLEDEHGEDSSTRHGTTATRTRLRHHLS